MSRAALRVILPLVAVSASGCLLLAAVGALTGAAATLVRPSVISVNCTTEGSALSLDAAVYAHTPQEVVDGLGTRTVDMTWFDSSARLTMSVSTTATEMIARTDDNCGGVVSFPATVTLSSDDGELDESFATTALARLDDDAWVVVIDHIFAPDGLGGTYTPETYRDGDVVGIGVQLRWFEQDVLGGGWAAVERTSGNLLRDPILLIGGETESAVDDKVGDAPAL